MSARTLAALALVFALVLLPPALAQSNPRVGFTGGERDGTYRPSGGTAAYEFLLTAQPAAGDAAVWVTFSYDSGYRPLSRVYLGEGEAAPTEFLGELPGTGRISVNLSHPDETYTVRVVAEPAGADGTTATSRLRIEAFRPSNPLASSAAAVYPYTFCFSVSETCAAPTPTTGPAPLPQPKGAVDVVFALPDGKGGALVLWNRTVNAEPVKDYLVFRLSEPTLIGTVSSTDIDSDGFYRFWDPEIPDGSHNYYVQPRAQDDVSTQLGGIHHRSNTVSEDAMLDLDCLATEQDADLDGLCDRVERNIGTDAARPDTDGDGLTDGDEVFGARNKGGFPSNPFTADTNGDGTDDFDEAAQGVNPAAAPSEPEKTNPWVFVVVALVVVAVVGVVLWRRKALKGV